MAESPFGASIAIYGAIPGAPPFGTSPAELPLYQVTVQPWPLPSAPQVLTDPFDINVTTFIGSTFSQATIPQNATGGYFTWQQMAATPAGSNLVQLDGLGGGPFPLAVLNSAAEGTYLISVTAMDPTTHKIYAEGTSPCTISGGVVIDLDQTPPNPSLQITGYQSGGVGPIITAVDCATFTVGDVIWGNYSVSDAHLGCFQLQAEPTTSPSSGFTVYDSAISTTNPIPGNGECYPSGSIPTGSVSGNWSYNTAGLPPCGYTIQLLTSDRTMVSCVSGGWKNDSKFQGFCLVAPE
jgi:hypothetical protein